MARVLDLRDILELINNRFYDGTLPQQQAVNRGIRRFFMFERNLVIK